MRIVRNTDKSYPCVNCGADDANIVREGSDPRLKCNRCNFMYDASQSKEAQEADAIPEGPPIVQDEPYVNSTAELISGGPSGPPLGPASNAPLERRILEQVKLPRTVTHIIIAKDRLRYDFCNSRTLKQKLFEWETAGKKYDLFELQPKQVTAKVDIQ